MSYTDPTTDTGRYGRALRTIAIRAIELEHAAEVETDDSYLANDLDVESRHAVMTLYNVLLNNARAEAPDKSCTAHYLRANGERDRLLAAARTAFLASTVARRDFLVGGVA
jgi:hypothetical protein